MTGQNNANCFVDVVKAAELLGYGARYVRQLCDSGKLKGTTKSKHQWKIPVAAIREIERQKRLDLEKAKRLEPYVLLYLATIGGKIQATGEQILKLKVQPVVDDYSKSCIAELEEKLQGLNRYFWEITEALKDSTS